MTLEGISFQCCIEGYAEKEYSLAWRKQSMKIMPNRKFLRPIGEDVVC